MKGYYRDTKFHRLIRNFVVRYLKAVKLRFDWFKNSLTGHISLTHFYFFFKIQGGDPTGTGTGKESASIEIDCISARYAEITRLGYKLFLY